MKKRECIAIILLCLGLFVCTGCGNGDHASEEKGETNAAQRADVILDGRAEVKYTERDLDGTFDEGMEVTLTESYTLTEEGVYVVKGTLDDGQLIVDADEAANVQIVLNGVDITSKKGPAIYVKSADKVFLTLAEGTKNTITDGRSYASALVEEDEPWGAVFSKDDLTINGSGSLTVNGNYLHGIVSKDSLKITGGNISVDAVEDGVRGKDEICIHDGNIAVTAAEDGLKSNNDEDKGRGNISIDGGNITIKGTGSQGIDAFNVAQILGGSLTIDSQNEGIQGKHIYIKDGTVEIEAVDDCLNAKDSLIDDSETNHLDALLEIAGGDVMLSTTAGDGLDSNGSILVSGGKTIVHGSFGGVEVAMDYNGTGTITGGVVLATGANGMAQNFDESSSQCSFMYDGNGSAGTIIGLYTGDGSELASFQAEHSFSSAIISTPDMKVGETYNLKIGDTESEVKLEQTITNSTNMMGKPGEMRGPGGMEGHHDGQGGPGSMPM